MSNGRSILGKCLACAVLVAAFAVPGRSVSGQAQPPAPSPAAPTAAPAGRGAAPQAPVVVSPEVLPDKRVVFRLLGPQATDVAVQGVGDEFNDGEWYEWIVYHEKTGATTGQVRFWHRKLTQGGVIVNNTFRFSGWSYVGVTGTDIFPQSRELALGVNKNRDTPVDQYVYWGPFEVVDGIQFPNPWGVGP